jgi:hypothetical protein
MPNVCHVPAVCSARYTVLSVGRMAELGSPVSSPFPLAIYSLSLRLAQKAQYWDPSVIPEDWHMYFRCIFADQVYNYTVSKVPLQGRFIVHIVGH